MIGISLTGSGKTLVFVLPAIILALEEEMKMPVIKGEGPFALVLLPSVKKKKSSKYLFLDII